MKICITSSGPNLDDSVDPRFGRCEYFIILDMDSMQFESIVNPSISAGGGAGIQSAQLVADKGVEAVLTGNAGPNAYSALQAAGINIVVGLSGVTVKETVEAFKLGKYQYISKPSVQSHYGMGSGSGSKVGRGMGRSIGMGRGMGMNVNQTLTQSQQQLTKDEEIKMLHEQSKKMKDELEMMQKRIDDLTKKND